MRSRRPAPRRRPPDYEDPAYLEYLRTCPCRAPVQRHAGGDPHHLRHDQHGNSLGAHLKDDRRAISLCRQHHRDIEQRTGPFTGWSRADVQAWENVMCESQRNQWHLHLAAEYLTRPRRAEAP